MSRFDLDVAADRRLSLQKVEGGFVLRLLELRGKWTYVTAPVPVSIEELREYERATRSAGAFVREWRFNPIWIQWEWMILRVRLDGEVFGEGNRPMWEAAVRRALLASP